MSHSHSYSYDFMNKMSSELNKRAAEAGTNEEDNDKKEANLITPMKIFILVFFFVCNACVCFSE